MCYFSATRKRERQEMDLQLFEKIAREIFPRTKFLYLSCATEPLMNRNFAAFLDCTAGYRVPFTSFCTNGILLNERIVESAISAGLSEIVFSVDGATADTYEYIRRGARWDSLLQKLRLVQSKKEQANSQLPEVRINFTCMKRNIRELPALIEVAAEHGVRNVHIRHLLPFPDENEGTTYREQMAYMRAFNDVASKTREEADRLGVQVFLPDPIPEKPGRLSETSLSKRNRKREANPYCLMPWFAAIINPTGQLRLCSVFPAFGNLREQSFREIRNCHQMRQLRRSLLRRFPDACSWSCSQEAYDVPGANETTLED
jgi:MoaA/NifB/PqqE/SkfB family radical SAM enzyme